MSHEIGRPVQRADAAAKASGATRYAQDVAHGNVASAVLVTSTIARGRIRHIDTAPALARPGVRLVLTHKTLDWPLGVDAGLDAGGRFQSAWNPLGSDAIHHHGQIVALVVADTIEIAEEAAMVISVDYEICAARADLGDADSHAVLMEDLVTDIGDIAKAFEVASTTVDATYRTPVMHHQPIELFGVTAHWTQDHLHLDLPTQWVQGSRAGIADILGIDRDRVSVNSPYLGGAFGSKAAIFWHVAYVAVAAHRIDRPVRLVVTRNQMFTIGFFRPETVQRVRLGADANGRLLAYEHSNHIQASRNGGVLALAGAHYAAHIYAVPAIRTREHAVPLDVNAPGPMRGPSEFMVNFAQEVALDELAVTLGVDPVELRLRNEPERDPVTGEPYSSRSLAECLRRGAERFGWASRDFAPGSMRANDGQLLGWGCASAWYPYLRGYSQAGILIDGEARAVVRASSVDMGTGSTTVLAQIAADRLGFRLDQVSVELGSSDFNHSPMVSGSSATATVGSAVSAVAEKARKRLIEAARRHPAFRGSDGAELEIREGRISRHGSASVPVAEVVQAFDGAMLYETAFSSPPQFAPPDIERELNGGFAQAASYGAGHSMFSFGAVFAEVRVDPLTRRLAVERLVGAYACGRIINPRTARSQLMGGAVWGIGHALMEETAIDRPRGRFANIDLGGYHFATNADVRDIRIEFVDEHDEVVNPLGAKGVGELGVIGVAPAIANAVHHATGIRVRKTPILLDDLLPPV